MRVPKIDQSRGGLGILEKCESASYALGISSFYIDKYGILWLIDVDRYGRCFTWSPDLVDKFRQDNGLME